MTRRGWAMFAAMCVIWGIPYLLIRVAVRDIEPAALVFLRTALGGLVLVPFALRSGGYGPVLRRWRPLLAFAVIEIAAPWLLLNDAEQHLPSSTTGLLVAGVPMVGVVLAYLLGAERTSALQALGLLLGLGGVGLLVGLDLHGLRVVSLLELIGVVVGYAVAPVIMARRLADLPSMPVVSAALLLVAAGYLPFGVAAWPSHVAGTGIASVVVLALVCTALAFVVFFALIAEIGPSRATVITYVNPAVAVLLGVLLLGEKLTAGMLAGFPLILAGSVLAARSSSRSRDQSMRTVPSAVSNVAATTPAFSSSVLTQETETPSRG
jgi:drug/metabolite transporter (DMT)-like permease